MKQEKIVIGNSDYTREDMKNNISGWGTTSVDFLDTINYYEENGYKVNFETNLFRKIFGFGIYKVVAYK